MLFFGLLASFLVKKLKSEYRKFGITLIQCTYNGTRQQMSINSSAVKKILKKLKLAIFLRSSFRWKKLTFFIFSSNGNTSLLYAYCAEPKLIDYEKYEPVYSRHTLFPRRSAENDLLLLIGERKYVDCSPPAPFLICSTRKSPFCVVIAICE